MLNFDDEEDDDFTIKSGQSTKLANLFGVNQTQLDVNDSNRTLIYTPPKQPKKIEISSNSNSGKSITNTMNLIHVSAVNVFKFENGKYNSSGKLGAALLGNHDYNTYKLILYTGKQQHITYASINENFKFICQPNNYCSFYDDNRQNWSLLFDNEEDKCVFNKQLVICKYNSIEKLGNDSLVLTQDLMLGNESSQLEAENNDTIELKYKGWLFEDKNSVEKLFISNESSPKNPFRIKLEGKWSEVLIGLKTGGKRFVLIPYKMRQQFSEVMTNAPNEHVLRYGLEFEVIKIRQRKGQNIDKQIDKNKTVSSSAETDKEISGEKVSHSGSVTALVSSVVEEENKTNKSKSDLLSRMARMGGLPILPVKQDINVKTEMNDTTDAQHNEDNIPVKPSPKPRNNSMTTNTSLSETSNTVSNRVPEMNINYNTVEQTNAQIPVSVPTSYQIPSYIVNQNSSIESNLSVLMNETRNYNTEVRIGLNKVIDKIDSLSEKVNDIKNSPNSNIPSLPVSSIGFMDSAILMSSIQRIVNENNSLKKEVDDKTNKLQTLNEKICDLLQQSNINMNHNYSSSEMERLLLNENRLKREIQLLTEECERFKCKNNDLILENSKFNKTIDEMKYEIENYSKKRCIDDYNISQTKEFTIQVKKIMNDVFRKFMSQIDENKTYRSEEIVEIVSNAIRSTTLAVFESKNSSESNSPIHQSVDEIDVKDKEVEKVKDIENISESKKEIKKPPILERKIIDVNNDSIQTINKSTIPLESKNIKESTLSNDIIKDSAEPDLSHNNLLSNEKSKTWKPKIPSNSPPDFEFVYEDSNE